MLQVVVVSSFGLGIQQRPCVEVQLLFLRFPALFVCRSSFAFREFCTSCSSLIVGRIQHCPPPPFSNLRLLLSLFCDIDSPLDVVLLFSNETASLDLLCLRNGLPIPSFCCSLRLSYVLHSSSSPAQSTHRIASSLTNRHIIGANHKASKMERPTSALSCLLDDCRPQEHAVPYSAHPARIRRRNRTQQGREVTKTKSSKRRVFAFLGRIQKSRLAAR